MTSTLLIILGMDVLFAIASILLIVFGIKNNADACIYIGALFVAVAILLFVISIQSLTKNV